jgi:hypothetical protein
MTTGAKTLFSTVAAVLTGAGFGQAPVSSDAPRALVWKGPGGCLVNFVNTPCRTVRYRWSSFEWSGASTASQYIEAFDRDGSQSTTIIATHRTAWLFPGQTMHKTELVLRKVDRVIYIDHERRIYRIARWRGKQERSLLAGR